MSSKRNGLLKAIGIWAPTVILGLFFVMQGLMKFDARAGWEVRFAEWGYPSPFHLVIGVLELIGGVLLFVPRLAAYAATLLAVVMLGALGTHLIHVEVPNIFVTLILATLFAVLAKVRWSRRYVPGASAMTFDGQAGRAE